MQQQLGRCLSTEATACGQQEETDKAASDRSKLQPVQLVGSSHYSGPISITQKVNSVSLLRYCWLHTYLRTYSWLNSSCTAIIIYPLLFHMFMQMFALFNC